ncbi:MAG: hypothetical protein PVJ67_05940 [Candidatus Pacearchaeota archaeon]|jgi:hypothetical protein
MKHICELIISPTRQRPRKEWQGLKKDEGASSVDVAVFDVPTDNMNLDCYLQDELKGVQFENIKIESELDANAISEYLKFNKYTFAYAPRGAGFYECLNAINRGKLITAFQEHPALSHVF